MPGAFGTGSCPNGQTVFLEEMIKMAFLGNWRKLAAAICKQGVIAGDREFLESEWFSDLLWFCESQEFRRKIRFEDLFLIPYVDCMRNLSVDSKLLREAIQMEKIPNITLSGRKYINEGDVPRLRERCNYLKLRNRARMMACK